MADSAVGASNRAAAKRDIITKVRTLVEALQDQGLSIEASYLYGSQVRGDARTDSDIDVAVVSPDLTGSRLRDWCSLNTVASRIDVRMEVVGFRPEQFHDEHPLVWEIKRYGVKLS